MITRNLALWVCGGSVTPGLPLPADSPAPEPSRDMGSGGWKSLLRLPGAGLRGWPTSRIWQQADWGPLTPQALEAGCPEGQGRSCVCSGRCGYLGAPPPTPAGSRETPSAPGLQKPQDALLSLVLKGLTGPRATAGLGGCLPVSWGQAGVPPAERRLAS